MKYYNILLYTVLICMIFPAHAENDGGITRDQAKSVVQCFYGALKALPNVSNNDFYEYSESKVFPHIIGDSDFRHPNDIQPLVSQLGDGESWKYISTYMDNIRKYSRDYGFSMEYSICDIKDLREVVYENLKERLALTYWEITVDKSFYVNGEKYVLNDTVDVEISNGKIALISNRTYREITLKPKVGDGKDIEAWHNELIARAARYWNQGRKKEAFDTYVKSIEDYDDPDTYFRIGVLLLKHHKECTKYNEDKARNLAYNYFCKARKLRHPEADRVIDWYWGDYNGPAI